ncbi:hypothetical protein DVH26_10505 [Paenibacillus sp. H1-7]|nr:DUF1629 domain-containing protein [Paenibacillus sp. H1-7]ULL14839.1 hypothetical protein DVH26_10505 [Paenibacillus sp. H1-7]
MFEFLDFSRAIVEIHPEYKVVTEIKKYAFQEELVKEETLFKIPQFNGRIFVTDKFRDLVIEQGLTGFEFEEVWDSCESETRKTDSAIIMKPNLVGKPYKFVEALDLIENGMQAVASDRYVLQNDNTNKTLLGILMDTGNYEWIVPAAFPPKFVEMQWYVTEKIEIK